MLAPRTVLKPGGPWRATVEGTADRRHQQQSGRDVQTPHGEMSVEDSQPLAVCAVSMQCAAAAREARVGHEIYMGAQRFCPREKALPRAVGTQDPALRIVMEVRLNDLIEDLLMHGRIL